MRWDYGKIYKEIRKSKGLTQEEICGDFLARSTLARIESGQVVPKFDTMIFLPIVQNYFNSLVFRIAMKKGRFR